MRQSRLIHLATAVALGLTLGAPLPAAAQTPTPAARDTVDSAAARSVLLPGVVVTASRSARPAREVAATVNVMPRAVIRSSPARTTDDLLRQVPGIELPRTSSTVSGVGLRRGGGNFSSSVRPTMSATISATEVSANGFVAM